MDDDVVSDELEEELNAPNDNEWNEDRYQQRMDKVANASANLGVVLLKGWTMLAEECPKCHSPLMSLRDAAPQCVECNPITDKPKSQKQAKKIKITKSKPPRQLDNARTAKIELNDDEIWRDAAFDKQMKKADDASAKIGELLLKGWTLLADHCKKCQTPLMALRGATPKCCNCDANDAKIDVLQKQQNGKYKELQQHNASPNGILSEEKKSEQNAEKEKMNEAPSQPPIRMMLHLCFFLNGDQLKCVFVLIKRHRDEWI